jgi:DNA-binding transcriptional regulator YiaG
MTKYDIKKELADLGLNQTKFADLIGAHLRTVQYWVANEQEPSNYAKFLFEITKQLPDQKNNIIAIAKSIK